MEARAWRRAGALVVVAVLCDSTARRAWAKEVIPLEHQKKCSAYATVRPSERTRLGFSPDDALRTLRVVPRRLHFEREMPMFGGAHLFAELGLSPATPDDEAVLTFVASGAPSTYCPADLKWPLSIPGTVTVRLSRGQVLTDTKSLSVYTTGGGLAGSVAGASLIGRLEVEIIGEFKADSASLSLWTGNGSDAHWFEVHRANDTAGAPPDLLDALKALGGRPMSCGGRSPAIEVSAITFGEVELRLARPNALPLTFKLPIRFAPAGPTVRGWRLAGPSSLPAAPPRAVARQAGCAREEGRPWWASFDVMPDPDGHLQARGSLSWPGGCAARVTCEF